MEYVIETHYYGDDTRIVISQDTDASNPRDDDTEFVGMFPLKTSLYYSQFAPGKMDEAWFYVASAAERYWIDTDEFVNDVTKYFAKLGIQFVIHEFMAQRHPVGTYLVYAYDPETTGKSIRLYLDELDKWLDGDVYVLTKQTKQKYVSVNDDRELDVWEFDDAVGGVYLDNVSNAVEAGEFFGLEVAKNVA